MNYKTQRLFKSTAGSMVAGAALCALAPPPVCAQVKAVAPYTVSTFATSPANASQPDSIVAWDDSIIVGFQRRATSCSSTRPGSELVFIANPGTASQSVSRTLVGTQLEDTVWIKPTVRGSLLVVDGKTNTIYSVKTKFAPGTIYTETPDDSGVSSFVGTLDLATGIIKPVVIGFSKATGLILAPGGEDDD